MELPVLLPTHIALHEARGDDNDTAAELQASASHEYRNYPHSCGSSNVVTETKMNILEENKTNGKG